MEWIWMSNQVTACIAISGEILAGLVDWLDASGRAEIENIETRVKQAIEKGERTLARIWTKVKLRSFPKNLNRAFYAAYVEYQATVWIAHSSTDKVGLASQATRLNQLLHACVHMLPHAFFEGNRSVANGLPKSALLNSAFAQKEF
jgi:hypothetical protein